MEKIYHENGGDEALKEIRNMKKMVRDALYEVRHIIYDLRPMALDDLGLIPTLKKYLKTTEEYFKHTQIRFVTIGEERRLPSKYEIGPVFALILPESVQNVMKHAEATEVTVKLEIKKDLVSVVVRDNGKGFDKTVKKTASFSLVGMEERVDILDGELSIDTSIGKGTIVVIGVPLIED